MSKQSGPTGAALTVAANVDMNGYTGTLRANREGPAGAALTVAANVDMKAASSAATSSPRKPSV